MKYDERVKMNIPSRICFVGNSESLKCTDFYDSNCMKIEKLNLSFLPAKEYVILCFPAFLTSS